jgi:hypothetical protein
MSQKSPDPSRGAAGDEPTEGSARDANDTTAPQGIPVVPRNIEVAADAALASMRVAYTRPAGSEHERRTMPPPVPMEQLVERMMLADSDRVPSDIRPIIHTPSGDSNPPGSDVDTVRTKMADMQRVPMSPAPSSAPQDEVPTVPPYPHDADTLPPSNIIDDTEPGFRPLMSEPPPPMLPTTSALDTAHAVLGELGVELFKNRPLPRDVGHDEPPVPPAVEDPPRNRPLEERRRLTPPSRLTPTRTMRPISDVIPPSTATGRNPPTRRRISEPGLRPVDVPPPPSERASSPGLGSMSDRVLEVRERYESGDHRAALRMAETILQEHPGHLAALGYAESSRQMLRQKYLARVGDMNMVPRIKHVAMELARVGVDARDMQILDTIDGVLTVEEIVNVAGVSTLDVLRVLNDLIVDGLVEFVGPATGRR